MAKGVTIPVTDCSNETHRHVIVARGTESSAAVRSRRT